MGLKNKLNKMKSFLFDEVEEKENKSLKSKEKKESKQVLEEKKEVKKKEEDVEELYFDDTNINLKTDDVIKSRVVKNEKEFKFPEFDDDDFMVNKNNEKAKNEPLINEKTKVIPLYQGSKRKEETKKFKPSPIISPIYGLLDNEGNSVKKENELYLTGKNSDEVTYDDVRKKAYGIVDEELSNTIEKLSSKTIEEAEKEMEEKEKALSREKVKSKKVAETEEDDMLLPNVDFKEIDIDKEVSIKKSKKMVEEDDDDEETKEQDLFKLIDTMYDKEGKDE